MPSCFRFWGSGGVLTSVLDCWGIGVGEEWAVNDCLARGDTGGVRMGLLEMGDGGTKGNDSRMESAPAEADVSTEDSDTLLSPF
jgi:hypothetical protein